MSTDFHNFFVTETFGPRVRKTRSVNPWSLPWMTYIQQTIENIFHCLQFCHLHHSFSFRIHNFSFSKISSEQIFFSEGLWFFKADKKVNSEVRFFLPLNESLFSESFEVVDFSKMLFENRFRATNRTRMTSSSTHRALENGGTRKNGKWNFRFWVENFEFKRSSGQSEKN